MANKKSAIKRMKTERVATLKNAAMRSRARTFIKKVNVLVEKNDYDNAMSQFRETTSVLDKLVGKGIYKKNTVARYKSRLNKKIKNLLAK